MSTRRRFLATGVSALLAGCSGTERPDDGFRLRSPAFEAGGPISERHTCEGENVSPPLRIESPPDPTAAFALVVTYPDAPGSQTTHWLLWNIPGDVRVLPAALPTARVLDSLDGARQGTNAADRVGYFGSCPPPGTDDATYWFTLSALDEPLDLAAGARRGDLEDALETHRLADVVLEGTVSRPA